MKQQPFVPTVTDCTHILVSWNSSRRRKNIFEAAKRPSLHEIQRSVLETETQPTMVPKLPDQKQHCFY